ncbi:MAG: GAF domain-containing sensor histidine kinase [Gaiellaceae bacterium]
MHSQPLSTLRHLRGLLEVSHRVRDERDLDRLVDRIAETISESLGFATVAINLYRPAQGDFRVSTVHGNAPARDALLGSTRPADAWEPFLADRFHRRGAYLIPHDEIDWERVPSYVPDVPISDDPDAWHPEDALIVPMRGADGTLLGMVSVDEPASGLRPGDEELEVLVAFAEHVAAAIEAAQDAAVAARDRLALTRLLDVSASLVELDSVDAVLDAVAHGIGDALGFEKVAVCLAEEDGFVPRGLAGWEPRAEGLGFAIAPADLERLFVPEFEREGCYLIENDVARALVGNASPYSSRRGGAGPRAWSRHWLLVPLADRDGGSHGFIWVDDPTDSLLPSPERLQALRTFANQAATALRAAIDFETLNARNTELAALHKATVALLDHRDPAAVLTAIVDSARSLVGTEHAYLYLVHAETNSLRLAVGLGFFASIEAQPLERGQGVSGRAWDLGKPYVVEDYSRWPGGVDAYRSPDLHATVGVPLLAGDGVVGVLGLVLDDSGRRFTEQEVALLARFAALAALALESSRLYADVQWQLAQREELNEQLRQAQKMESVGRLAGGIAHDFNNLLTAIRGYAELLLLDLHEDAAARESAAQIARAAERAAALTSQLLAFGRKQVLRPQSLDLNQVVEAVAPMLGRVLGEDVVLTTALDSELGLTLADPTQIEQVLLNLAVNARDAMPGGGRLLLRTANVELDEGRFVALVVADTGSGMDSDTAAHAFEPFFTTKEVGAGTGLGLATVHGIVAQSGGSASVVSEPGAGTTFTVHLPRVD